MSKNPQLGVGPELVNFILAFCLVFALLTALVAGIGKMSRDAQQAPPRPAPHRVVPE